MGRTITPTEMGWLASLVHDCGVERVAAAARDCQVVADLESTIAIDAKSRAIYSAMTAKQRELFCLYAKGVPMKVIARKRGIAPNTVKQQIRTVRLKFGVKKAAQATAIAARIGLQ